MRVLAGQRSLFSIQKRADSEVPEPKYRRQSFHVSDSFPDRLTVRWNKSFDIDSIIYRAAACGTALTANESLPNSSDLEGRLEALVAPYQRDDADADHPDVLFFWASNSN
jgi:hypothetical protein